MAADTICAIASPPGPGRRGVIRLSGPAAFAIAAGLLDAPPPARRGAVCGDLRVGEGPIPARVLCMPGPGSFTREDVLELHLSGNPYLLQAVLKALLEAGARLAEPGEFTRRAFLGGRLDLTQAEGLLALIHAQNEGQRRAATALLVGGLEQRLGALRSGLDALRALCEASLDFDEADTGHVPRAELLADLRAVQTGLDEALAWQSRRESDVGPPLVVLAGRANVGKSTLFNRLCPRAIPALVEDAPGSTRDVLSGTWELASGAVTVQDTAGIETLGAQARVVERLAQARARERRQAADLVLWVVDARAPGPVPADFRADALVLWNQIDRSGVPQQPEGDWADAAPEWVALSAAEGRGLQTLESAVAQLLGSGASEGAFSLGLRHRRALEGAAQILLQAREGLELDLPLDLVAQDLRAASDQLDEIAGTTTAEDLLDRIFAQFCLGK
ncbi:MAG: tRNA modification GTPase [Planctomycetota bacterium]